MDNRKKHAARAIAGCALAFSALIFAAQNPAWAQARAGGGANVSADSSASGASVSSGRLGGQSAAPVAPASIGGKMSLAWMAQERAKWDERPSPAPEVAQPPQSALDGFKKMIDEGRAQEEAARGGLSAAGLGGLLSEQSAGALIEVAAQGLDGSVGRDAEQRALAAKSKLYAAAFSTDAADDDSEPAIDPQGKGSSSRGFAIEGGMQALADRVIAERKLDAPHAQALRRAIAGARFASQGVPGAAHHPMSAQECKEKDLDAGKLKGGESDRAVCGSPWMAKVPGSNVCIDRFEYPNLPCQYPVTWVQAKDAAAICEAEGKRLCDAREWEGACAAKPQAPEWTQSRDAHNASREKIWPTGKERNPSVCAMGIPKSASCNEAIAANKGVREACGANTWPAGSHPDCGGPLGVYDQQGNAAEHMNLPRNASEQGANGGHGVTEMKGAWFAFPQSQTQVHPDDCEWREPGWHRTGVLDARSHANYHLGFRCCKDIAPSNSQSAQGGQATGG